MSQKNITISIANRPYNIKIQNEEEAIVKLAEKTIREKMSDFALKFAHADQQDLLAMVLLDSKAVELKHENEYKNGDSQLKEQISKIEHIINASLDS